MYKAVFTLLSLLPVFFFSLLDGEDVSITQKVPDQMELGEVYQVDLIFNKGEAVQGFGKFQAEFPTSFDVTLVEGAGATFTYSEGVMKLIWVNLPSESQFVVSYEITPSDDAPAKVQIGGKFSYLLENERKSFALFPETVKVGDQEELAEEAAEEEEEEFSLNIFRKVQKTAQNKYDVSFVIQKSGIKGFSKIEEYVPRGALVEANETMNASFSYLKNKIKFVWLATPEDEEMIVTYSVDLSTASDQDIFNTYGEYSYLDSKNKTQKILIETRQANMKPPVKEEEPIAEETNDEAPKELNIGGVNIKLREATEEDIAQMNATESEAKNESEAKKEEKESMPEESTEDEAMAENTADSEGVNKEEAPKKLEETPSQGEESLAQNDSEVNSEVNNDMPVEEEVKVPAKEMDEAPKESFENTSASTESNLKSTSKIKAPQTGVFYRVQIAAGKNIVNADYFQSRHQWSTPFVIENHEGWVKYTTENTYPVYRDARDSRNNITSGFNFDGPFVTAYNAGERITVQEALMISNQKWFK